MKQQMKILITRKGDESEGIWLTLPISQKHFEKLTRDVDFDEIEITKVCCNNYTLSQHIMHSRITSKNLSKLNYLGQIFYDFGKSQRVLFGMVADKYLCPENPIDDFVNLALNVKENNSDYELYEIEIPTEFKIRIRRKK